MRASTCTTAAAPVVAILVELAPDLELELFELFTPDLEACVKPTQRGVGEIVYPARV